MVVVVRWLAVMMVGASTRDPSRRWQQVNRGGIDQHRRCSLLSQTRTSCSRAAVVWGGDVRGSTPCFTECDEEGELSASNDGELG